MAMSQDLSNRPRELQNPIGDSPVSKDDLWDDRDADTLSLRERYMIAKTEQINHETRVKDATAALLRRPVKDSTTQLGNIRGEWIPYSSEYLDIYANEPDPDIDGTEWNAGTLIIDEDEMDEYVRDPNSDIGIRVDFLNGPVESYHIDLKTPRFASLYPITRVARGCEDFEDPALSCYITFVGDGLLEMRIPGRVLAKGYGYGVPEVYFVGCLDQRPGTIGT